MYEVRNLDDETSIGIILGHADTEEYLNRPRANNNEKCIKPINGEVPQKMRVCLQSMPSNLSEASRMKREMVRDPCLKTCLILSVLFCIAGIALVVVGTVMLTKQASASSSSTSSNGNHQWMLILGLLVLFAAIASYLCLRNYCVYHLGDTPVKVLSIDGEEDCREQCHMVQDTDRASWEKETPGETDDHLKERSQNNGRGLEMEEGDSDVYNNRYEESTFPRSDMARNRMDSIAFIDEDEVEMTSHLVTANNKSPLNDPGYHLDVEFPCDFKEKLRRMSKVSQV